MRKTTKETITIERYKHSFYCDECGKHLGTSEENDEAWYRVFGDFRASFYIDTSSRCSIKKHLCDECREKFVAKIISTLVSIGFEEE